MVGLIYYLPNSPATGHSPRRKFAWYERQARLKEMYHHQPINVLTAGAQAFLMDYT
jgi:hypothetical protein